MKYQFVILILTLIISSCGSKTEYSTHPISDLQVHNQNVPIIEPITPITKMDFRIMSYNMKAIPTIFSEDIYTKNNTKRAIAFSSYLQKRIKTKNSPDIILLQEIFDPNFLKIMIAESGYKYWYTDHPGGYNIYYDFTSAKLKATSSGLLILSRHPIISRSVHYFPFDLCELSDCYAKKGVLWTRIQVKGSRSTFDIFNTHLQAGSTQDAIRASQVKEMHNFVKARAISPLVLFGGDFNFRLNGNYDSSKIYNRLYKQKDSLIECRNDLDCNDNFLTTRVNDEFNLLDHIFYKSNNSINILNKESIIKDLKYLRNFNELDLSDHPMIEFTYHLSW